MSKTVLITGTSTGLGISLAVQCAQNGHHVYATMRNLDKRAALEAALDAAGVSAIILALDVTDADSIIACVDRVISDHGHIDVLINNAGAGFVRTTEQASESEVAWIMDVNFNGVVRATKAVLPHMRAARTGHVINISSVGGLVGQPFNEIYCAAKFAVEGYTESLASYVGPAFGIHFTAVEPGGIATDFAKNVLDYVGQTGGILDDPYKPILEQYLATVRARGTQTDGPIIHQSADSVAQVVCDIMAQDNPPIRARTSEWSENFTALKTTVDPDGKKQQMAVIDMMLGGQPIV